MPALRQAPWGARELIVLTGGPVDPRWLFADDLAKTCSAYATMGRTWPYRRTGDVVAHPDVAATGIVHRFIPGGAL